MNVLIFGATGSAGGSILRACLSSPVVDEVRAITRRPLALTHAKLRPFVHRDYQDYAAVAEAFAAVDACLFCLGVSVTQVAGEQEYRIITHDFALAAARTLRAHKPDATFHFISGQGTSSTSRLMWARVKAQTERELIDQIDAVCWRPAAIDGEPSRERAARVPGAPSAVSSPEAFPEPLRHGRESRAGDAAGHRRGHTRVCHRKRPDPRHRRARPSNIGGTLPNHGA